MKLRVAAVFVSTMLLFHGAVQAMEMPQYDKLTEDDQSSYVGCLTEGVANLYTAEGKPEVAEKMRTFFNLGQDGHSAGFRAFLVNLDIVRQINEQNKTNPAKKQFGIEDAFLLTLKKNGFELPNRNSVMLLGQSFKPSSPSPTH